VNSKTKGVLLENFRSLLTLLKKFLLMFFHLLLILICFRLAYELAPFYTIETDDFNHTRFFVAIHDLQSNRIREFIYKEASALVNKGRASFYIPLHSDFFKVEGNNGYIFYYKANFDKDENLIVHFKNKDLDQTKYVVNNERVISAEIKGVGTLVGFGFPSYLVFYFFYKRYRRSHKWNKQSPSQKQEK
jgi:hypothetical protein